MSVLQNIIFLNIINSTILGGKLSMAKKKVRLDKTLCIGCGVCVGTYPEDFKFGDDGLAELCTDVADEESVGVCPCGAISVEE